MSSSIETPLHYFHGQQTGSGDAQVTIFESPLCGHLNLRGNPQDEQFLEGVESVVGVKPPTTAGSCASSGDISIYWLGPDEWLLLLPESRRAEVESELRNKLSGHFSVVDVSGGQTLLNVRGDGVADMLKKSASYDFHSNNFPAGRCVQTHFAKATALVSKKDDGSFDLVIRRSFADYLASWLLDAGEEFGCRVVGGGEV
ncbi:sarcosine oxidase subunit gamma family protein [Porticoccus sp. W117]|uniref:sarcosine oxidase subunit gamma n=1 Tax=Porticoccus sp. W117 TaxID=3054777 RepID=UPI002594EFEC|nr:sarcosine oxidase subunit gamma family protein [Porticoccus sp. W117]MDM3871382.1 sarcosine oxidase subunit gamma family protein [Porticoccus sp. W117]